MVKRRQGSIGVSCGAGSRGTGRRLRPASPGPGSLRANAARQRPGGQHCHGTVHSAARGSSRCSLKTGRRRPPSSACPWDALEGMIVDSTVRVRGRRPQHEFPVGSQRPRLRRTDLSGPQGVERGGQAACCLVGDSSSSRPFDHGHHDLRGQRLGHGMAGPGTDHHVAGKQQPDLPVGLRDPGRAPLVPLPPKRWRSVSRGQRARCSAVVSRTHHGEPWRGAWPAEPLDPQPTVEGSYAGWLASQPAVVC